MTEPRPIPDNALYCCTSQYQCVHLFVPRASAKAFDRCRRFQGTPDRDDRQRPERIIACLVRWPNAEIPE